MPSTNPEAALEEFERLAENADVNIDTSTMNEADAKETEETREFFTKAIEEGRLMVDAEGRAVMPTKKHGEVVFRPPLGEDLMIMASAREDRRMEAMGRFASAITGKDTRSIGKLEKNEWKLLMRVAGFLAAD